jgi:type IV pilus assembly protein PilZ
MLNEYEAPTLFLSINDKSNLYSSYMAFVKHGGLFIPTYDHYEMGQNVFLTLSLLLETTPFYIHGKVVWMTPKQSESYRTCGIGIQFTEQEYTLKTKIEAYLATMQDFDFSTYTL